MNIFTPVRKDLHRWSTPGPANDWMMVGHLLIRDSGCLFIDPPSFSWFAEHPMQANTALTLTLLIIVANTWPPWNIPLIAEYGLSLDRDLNAAINVRI